MRWPGCVCGAALSAGLTMQRAQLKAGMLVKFEGGMELCWGRASQPFRTCHTKHAIGMARSSAFFRSSCAPAHVSHQRLSPDMRLAAEWHQLVSPQAGSITTGGPQRFVPAGYVRTRPLEGANASLGTRSRGGQRGKRATTSLPCVF